MAVSNNTLNQFRKIAVAEGISYLVLVFIAMPFKYFMNMPQLVLYTGWVHGFLFVAYCILLLVCWVKYKWSFWKATWAFVASLLPFGTFILDKQLRSELRVKS